MDFGIRCIVSTGFADIFFGNCVKNGILCVTLPKETVRLLMGDAEDGRPLDVDLETQRITRAMGEVVPFSIPADAREKLLSGADEIDRTLLEQEAIGAFEDRRAGAYPWL